MYRFLYRLRILVILILVVAVIGGVAYVIITNDRKDKQVQYNRAVTAAVETAIADTFINITRTVEAPLMAYRIVQLGEDEPLSEVAEEYGTSVEAIQMVNGFPSDVLSGNGERIVVPVGVTQIIPSRQIQVYMARFGDTLATLASENNIPLSLLEADNPVLVERDLSPGDTVFIAQLF
ncbi:MAG: LysM peptidoglycan-binding domain-containing protein [Anaerolineae bacterium]|nr:LysM peptidoglycan-binding domain-containing protein [Anaerolineae bacterium]